jgi:hypothetical protein
MIFKPRTPAVADATPDQPVPAEQQKLNAQTESQGETVAQVDTASEADPMAGAFNAVARVVRDEMKSMRSDIVSRIESLRQSQQQAMVRLDERTKGSIAKLHEQFETATEDAGNRTDEVKAGLEEILAGHEQKLESEMDTLTATLSSVRQDLEQEITTTGKVSTLLNDMAKIFDGPQKLPQTR